MWNRRCWYVRCISGMLTRFIVALSLAFSSSVLADRILVLDFELNDLTLYPKTEEETARAAMLRPLLVEQLEGTHGHESPAAPGSAAEEAGKGQGYVFDRPEVAARLGREVNADWVLTGRLHKPSHLFVYLKAQLIDARTGRMTYDFVVELKGAGEKLTRKGSETLALQIDAAMDAMAPRSN